MSQKKYYFQADVIRAVAAIGVVILHAFDPVYFRPDFFGGKIWWITHIIASLLRSCVPLFIILSGYLNLGKNRTFEEHWMKTKNRILIPLFSFFGIYILFDIFTKRLPWKGFETIVEIYDRFNINTQSILYFLIIIFFLYILTPFLNLLFSQTKKIQQYFILGFLALGVISAITRFTTFSHEEYFYNTYNNWISYIGYYLAGYYIKNMFVSTKNYNKILLVFCVSLLITIAGSFLMLSNKLFISEYFLIDNISYFANYLSINVIIQSLSLFALLIHSSTLAKLQKRNWFKKLIKLFAKNSFGIFLTHILIIYFIDFGVDKFFTNNLTVFLLINTFTTLFFALLLTQLIRKTSMRIIIGE
ncbi:hypothetical protein COX93_00015 [Candidatus Nomurabacteria bacterium CG_4_10_14_0_2_um_filter_30_12]|uniref:Acyltransferase 3 domain-containing protein n=1 Tax=Candidatus Nomurabacteria bacterium CG_4_10_14_0_2_um_filter_30_12 TaxID=1974727 RepID=A0A2J0MGR3_9BACT|nr:MAG: hypothetical protein COX93_00015 [Candidatus Nomurabacteria bacterium CG_4_10_14_0_2_um_filter_30_12]